VQRIRLGNDFIEENSASIEEELKHALNKYAVKLISYNEEFGLANVNITTTIAGEELNLESRISIKYNKTICKQSAQEGLAATMKRYSRYAASLSRLRGFKNSVKNYFVANNEFVTKEEQINSGINMYLSSKKLAESYLSVFKIKAKKSFTLHTVKNGKKLYRNTYSIQL